MKQSYHIGFMMINELSSFNAAFGLARMLKDRGHEVLFVVESGTVFPQYARVQGFASVEMLPYYALSRSADEEKKTGFRPFKGVNKHAQRVSTIQKRLADLIKRNSIDLVFFDNLFSYPYATVLAKMRVPTILLFPNFGSRVSSAYPPVFSSVLPRGGKMASLRQRAVYVFLWVWAVTTRGRARSYGVSEYINSAYQRIALRIYQTGFERNLRKMGWKSTWSEWGRRAIIPEIVLGHRSLDWDAVASNPERCYFALEDHFRKDFDFDWAGFDSKAPLVFCNVSTARGFQQIQISKPGVHPVESELSRRKFRLAKRFLDVTIEAFSRRKDWQLILACGPFSRGLQAASLPGNIHVFDRVPQLSVLARADLAITWGGAGTIRECVNSGVPMLVFPVWTDQFGNAARVSFRNLGICGDILNLTSEKMIGMMERILNDKTIGRRFEEMRREWDAEKEIGDLVRFVGRHTGFNL